MIISFACMCFQSLLYIVETLLMIRCNFLTTLLITTELLVEK